MKRSSGIVPSLNFSILRTSVGYKTYENSARVQKCSLPMSDWHPSTLIITARVAIREEWPRQSANLISIARPVSPRPYRCRSIRIRVSKTANNTPRQPQLHCGERIDRVSHNGADDFANGPLAPAGDKNSRASSVGDRSIPRNICSALISRLTWPTPRKTGSASLWW